MKPALSLALAALLLLLPGCQLFNAILNLAPAALMFLEAPESVEPSSSELDLAAAPIPLDEALELYLERGATGTAWIVPAGRNPPAEAVTPSGPGLKICRLPVSDARISSRLLRRMDQQGLTLVRVPPR